MLKLSCPACGGEITFKSKASIYAVCSFCKSSLLRHDHNLEIYGKVSEVLDDLTPLQVGTKGEYAGNTFEIVGRLRMGWENGFWNEWYVLFNDGKEGWLAQAQGFYGICFANTDFNPPPRSEALFGCYVEVRKNQDKYQIIDIKNAVCLGSEGELPFPSPVGRESISIDLNGGRGRFATIEYPKLSDADLDLQTDFYESSTGGSSKSAANIQRNNTATSFYVGEYLEFDDFNFQNLKELEGW